MPNYDYKCKECDFCKDIFHSIKDCENPNDDTIEKMKCDCGEFDSITYERQVSLVEIGKYSGMSKEQKRETLVKRSKEHSKKFFKDNGIRKKI